MRFREGKNFAWLAVFLVFGLGEFAQADTVVNAGVLHVTATVQTKCGVTVKNVDFGNVNPANSDVLLNTPGKVTVSCSVSGGIHSVQVGLSGGLNFSQSRQMHNDNNNLLAYELYQDSNLTQNWGDLNTGHDKALPLTTANGNSTGSLNVYAKIFQNANVAAGDYSDIVSVNLSF